jgi:DNA-binding HxlR family transcriptional regulator
MKSEAGTCPISKVAILLSDTWTMLIMHHVIDGPKRFSEIDEALSSISSRTLTLKLKKLLNEGMIKKDKNGFYEATPKGKGLKSIESEMMKYQKKYL